MTFSAFLKKISVIALVLAVLAIPAEATKRVAVVPFETPQEYAGTPLSRALTDMIITELVKAGGIEVIERSQLDKILREQDLKVQGIVDPQTAREAGRVLGVDYIVGGKISEFGVRDQRTLLGGISKALGGAQVRTSTARVALDFRLIDAESARVLLAEKAEAEQRSSGVAFAAGDIRNLVLIGRFDTREWAESQIGRATRKAVEQVVGSMLGYFPATGRVLAVFNQADTRYAILNIGAFSGVETGQDFPVYREEVVFDSEGVEVWRERKDVGLIRVVEVQNERSKARIITEDPLMNEGDVFTWERLDGPAGGALARVETDSSGDEN